MSKNTFTTQRNTNKLMEDLLEKETKILDKGFIRVIDYMGDDNSIVQAARVSYGKGTKSINSDRALIRYLLKHQHTTPFEMCEIKFHIKAPIFVARQWLRHRTANVNEYSGRYSIMEEDYYIPEENQVREQSSSNKQGRSEIMPNAKEIQTQLYDITNQTFSIYNQLVDEKKEKGLAKEIARTILPVNIYTQFYWKIDLHNLLHFLKLRSHSHAQYEIREYALKMLDIIKKWLPHTYEAFIDYIAESHSFSREELKLIRKLIKGEKVQQEDTSLSNREWSEFKQILEID